MGKSTETQLVEGLAKCSASGRYVIHFGSLLSKGVLSSILDSQSVSVNIYRNKHCICHFEAIQKKFTSWKFPLQWWEKGNLYLTEPWEETLQSWKGTYIMTLPQKPTLSDHTRAVQEGWEGQWSRWRVPCKWGKEIWGSCTVQTHLLLQLYCSRALGSCTNCLASLNLYSLNHEEQINLFLSDLTWVSQDSNKIMYTGKPCWPSKAIQRHSIFITVIPESKTKSFSC